MTTREIEAWVLDYACRHRHHEVIAALFKRHRESCDRFDVSDARLSCAALHRIVYCRELSELGTAVQLVQQLYDVIRDDCPLRIYFRLVYALKMKVLLDLLKTSSLCQHTLNMRLNQYFPRAGALFVNTEQRDGEKLQKMVSNFRKFFLSLIINPVQRQAYLQDEYHSEFGDTFMTSLERHVDRFLDVIEKFLPVPVIEKMLEKGSVSVSSHIPSMASSFDVLLECLVNKTSLESRDLLDILTLLHPISTQDKLRPPLHLTFGSDDSSASNDSNMNMAASTALSECPADINMCVSNSQHTVYMSSGESISIISKKKPHVRCTDDGDHGDDSQVYVISSSSDSTATHTDKSHRNSYSERDMVDTSSFADCSSLVIPSSHLEEPMQGIAYPSLAQYQNIYNTQLCVVKLFRNQGLDVTKGMIKVAVYS